MGLKNGSGFFRKDDVKHFLVNSIGRIDMICWILVVVFFCTCAVLFNGDLNLSFIAAALVCRLPH